MSIMDSRIPVITTEQMQEVPRLVVEKYGNTIIQTMENAGRNLAELVRRLLGNSVLGKRVIVAFEKGNNGGGGIVVTRHLHNWRAEVAAPLSNEQLLNTSETQRAREED